MIESTPSRSREQSTIAAPPKVFVSYAHKDQEYFEQLEVRLRRLQNLGLIQSWTDKEIMAGEKWNDEIQRQLDSAEFMILLVSEHYLTSEYIQEFEEPVAAKIAFQDGDRVIPIILKPCSWKSSDMYKSVQVLPRSTKPVASWENVDDAWFNIYSEMERRFKAYPRETHQSKFGKESTEDHVPHDRQLPNRKLARRMLPFVVTLLFSAACIFIWQGKQGTDAAPSLSYTVEEFLNVISGEQGIENRKKLENNVVKLTNAYVLDERDGNLWLSSNKTQGDDPRIVATLRTSDHTPTAKNKQYSVVGLVRSFERGVITLKVSLEDCRLVE